jgi:hypothetical protein
MTQTTATYNLTVCQKDPLNSQSAETLSVNSSNPQELLRLLQLSGQQANTVYSLNVMQCETNCAPGWDMRSTINTVINSSNSEAIAAALGGTEQSCAQDPTEFSMMEAQAEYDYGEDHSEDRHTYTIVDYDFKGKADLPERLTSARFGSNPLKSEMKESVEFQKLREQYDRFLNEADVNDDGAASPLTADSRQEFDKDPLAGEQPVDDGSRSPLSKIERQTIPR